MITLLDQRQGELRKVSRVGSVLIAVMPVHLLREYARHLLPTLATGETFRLLVNGGEETLCELPPIVGCRRCDGLLDPEDGVCRHCGLEIESPAEEVEAAA